MIFFIKSLIIGYGILLIAIVLNFLAIKFGIKTWNEFLTKGVSNLSFLDVTFLFIIYPLILGAIAFILFKVE